MNGNKKVKHMYLKQQQKKKLNQIPFLVLILRVVFMLISVAFVSMFILVWIII